ncbi:MAG: amylo-alpha-1,6-glucosidase, partial [candidate division KSB1 bacterium]
TATALTEAYHLRSNGGGAQVFADLNDKPLRLEADPNGKLISVNAWRTIELYEEQTQRFNRHEVYLPCAFEFAFEPGTAITLLLAYSGPETWNGEEAFKTQLEHQRKLTAEALNTNFAPELRPTARAARNFIIARPTAYSLESQTILAGYPDLTDYGREAMMALPGLLLCTGKCDLAKQVFNIFLKHSNQGLIPNYFSPRAELPNYESLDATLWMFSAFYEYWLASGDDAFVAECYPTLLEVLHYHLAGATPSIKYDALNGMLMQTDLACPMTWMNARAGNWVATPRNGRAIEVQALWYNALMVMVDFSRLLDKKAGEQKCSELAELAGKTLRERFWNEEGNYIFDCLYDPPLTNAKRTNLNLSTFAADDTLRPNALIATGMPFTVFNQAQIWAVVDLAMEKFVTPFGLRTLASDHPGYYGQCVGTARQIATSLHNGAVHPWLVVPFVRSYLRAYANGASLLQVFMPLFERRGHPTEGVIAQMYDGDAPHHARGVPAFAASTGAVLQAYELIRNG